MVRIAGEEFPNDMACVTCVHVLDGQAVRLVSRDDVSDWQFLCAQLMHEPSEARVISLAEVVALDNRLAALAPLEIGEARSI